jgi:hypothetical protein
MKPKLRSVVVCAALAAALLEGSEALAHHSNVAFEVNKVLTVSGVVTEFKWANPHTWIGLTVDDGKRAAGGKVEWALEGRAPGVLLRAGWTRSSIKPGETVTVDFSPAKDGSKTGLVARVTKADGSILPNAPPTE